MEKLAQLKRQATKLIDQYLSGAASATELSAWADANPVFAHPKALDNSEDWVVSNALALMSALTDPAINQSRAEAALREARQFLTGEAPFPQDRWPVGLLRSSTTTKLRT